MMISIALGLRYVRAISKPRCRRAGDERSHTLKRTDAWRLPGTMESRRVEEPAKECGLEMRDAAVRSSVQISLFWNAEGAEPGSTSVDGSSQALRPTKVRYIMRTLLT